jgi:phosphoglucosamine mutase
MEALRPVADEVGKATRIEDARGRYIVFLKNTFPKKYTLDEFHIVLDCANGATYGVAPHVFAELGAKVTTLSATPDGKNINLECGALHPEKMAAKVKELGADIGLALDGDGDRLIVCDENGQIVDGDHVMAICAQELMSQRKLKKKTLVSTVMSNMGLEVAMEKMGGKMVRAAVGDRYVVECMRKRGYSFGGEQSGHLVFLDHITTGDGILAGLQLLAIMKKCRQPLSELATIMKSFPQVLKNVRTSTKIDVSSIQHFPETVLKLEEKLGRTGRILVRPSGTEPVIRVMVEGQDEAVINEMADELCGLVQMADRN